ncbi:hypothetical protein L249_5491 [Ophiocordyceps polyrhachis-furcata BCC 54312]|uniref:Sterol regulatory element-binding protein cleavage-activating protein n=1 Tax=Ophiocordyceps polyrhachis-furcata BCC 54312 TaxID=1330021 RepID=A0A367LGR6_9HYPO|nr:hypothetical protein L249_5491 [Ophiocordyceps polyrhachis-furcata BCC 54312]
MIWYILYPLRGTTEAPTLPSSHPLYNAFARYGRYAARHVVATLLVSAAVATVLVYPIPFLFTSDFVNGASNLPRHVWTVAQPLPYGTAVEPDVIMRSIWVHASYMQALNTELLVSALNLQDDLLGITKNFSPASALHTPSWSKLPDDDLSLTQRDAIHVANGLTPQSWFFHSPLLYWGCCRERIMADDDILSTINNRKNQSTFANVTLRHSIVFSGKRFEERRLLAADSLVITLLHLQNSSVGRQWERRALELPQKVGDQWNIYPSDGRVASSQLYEFQFRPISVQDIASLALAYGLALVYFLASLSKLRAVKSRVGLIVTVLAQIIFSIMSSFTVCAIFNIDLSRIPRAAYPLVVLAMSLEHIFRLINAVILTPLEDIVSDRIGQAFAETAPTAMFSTLQNILILAGLSRLVSPGVSGFCIFAAIAIVFDFFYLNTFFLAVLSVDVRRMELGDALAKASMRHNRNKSDTRGVRRSWWDPVLQGRIAMSTRIAGTIVMFGFVLIAQWHFFSDEGLLGKLERFYKDLDGEQTWSQPGSSLLDSVHQARSPTSWLRIQDHDTAREVINIIKPSSHSYVARVYDPIVFVLKNSDRVPHSKEPTLLPAAYDFVKHEMARFLVVVVVVIAALRLLTNFLLWEDEENIGGQHEPDELPLVSVKSLAKGHLMDIVLLTASADGHVVSVGLDNTIRVWSLHGVGTSYVIAEGDGPQTTFPVVAVAIDDDSKWLVLLSRPRNGASSSVTFWNLQSKSWGSSVQADSCRHRPVALLFDPSAPGHEPQIMVIQQDGSMSILLSSEQTERPLGAIFPPHLICARLLAGKGGNDCALARPTILTVSRQGEVYMAARYNGDWRSRRLAISGLGEPGAYSIQVVAPLNLFVVTSGDGAHLVDGKDGVVLQTLRTAKMLPRPLRCAYTRHGSSQLEPTGLASFTLGYVEADSRDVILQTYMPADDCDAIYLQTPCESRNNNWCTWDAARETRKRVVDPGVWDMISDGSAVGIRYVSPAGKAKAVSGLRNRYGKRTAEPDPLEGWQVWMESRAGCRREGSESYRLIKDGEQAEHLLVTKVGPKAPVGLNSVAFAFGDMTKLVIVGTRMQGQGGPATDDIAILFISHHTESGGLSGMASSEVDQKFLGRLARAVESDNPLLSSILFKILGLSLNLAEQLVAAKKQRRPDPAAPQSFLKRVLHIIWLSREGLVMLQQYVIPMVGNYVELKVLAYKLRASFHHIFVLFHNQPPVSDMTSWTPELMAAASDMVRMAHDNNNNNNDDDDYPPLSSVHPTHHPLDGGPVGPPPGFEPHVALLPPSFLLPSKDYLPTAHEYFKEAAGLADDLLWGSHSLRLSVKTEYAAFLYDCVHDADASRQLAKDTIAEVYDATEGMDDDMFRDACELVTVLGKMMTRGLDGSKPSASKPPPLQPPITAPPPGMENAI